LLLTRRHRAARFAFTQPRRSGRLVLELEGETVAAGGRELLRDVTFALERGEHVALIGPNGTGKTTLLERIVKHEFKVGHGVELGYFSQHGRELDERGSVLECVQSTTGLIRPDAQALLGRFGFSGWDEHRKPVRKLSGGERRRLGLALLVESGANFLVLDEPTNHLDLESREILEAALEGFNGTVLVVTHDRALIDAVAERTLAIEDGTIRGYDGGWAEYVKARQERAGQAETPAKPAGRAKPKSRRERPVPKAPDLAAIEAQIEAQERLVADLEQHLASNWEDQDAIRAHRAAREELHALLARWEILFEVADS
jgi:ATP-binding cassette subfamily F protein 3